MRVCGDKRKLEKGAALKEATWWTRRRLYRMSAYPCSKCGGWHVGTYRPRKPRRVRR